MSRIRISLISLVISLLMIAACATKQPDAITAGITKPAGIDVTGEPLPFSAKTRVGVLDNGIRYYIIHNDMPTDKVELRLNVRSGSNNETESELGLAHFVEHMAFNGTIHYKSNDLVRFMEEAGLTFGSHSNAYTSYDNTNYMLSIPANNEKLIEESFAILRDWADGLVFDPEEIDSEKGVITEEWRTRNDAYYRINVQSRENMYAGSLYATRDPIGDMNIVANADRALLKGYYDRWYASGNMAVVVVGNISPEKAEELIKKYFNTVEKRSAPEKADNRVPVTEGLRVRLISDPEATTVRASIIYFHKGELTETYQQLKTDVVEAEAVDMFMKRVSGKILNKEVDLLSVGAARFNVSGSITMAQFTIGSAADRVTADLKTLLSEIERVKRYGFTETELDEHISNRMTYLTRAARPDYKHSSYSYANELSYYDTHGGYFTDFEQDKALYERIFAETSLAGFNAAFNRLVSSSSKLVTIILPEKDLVNVRMDNDIWESYERDVAAMTLEAYTGEAKPDSLMSMQPEGGVVTSVEKIEAMNSHLVTYGNGARLFIRNNPADKGHFAMYAQKPGGYAVLNDTDVVIASLVSSVVDASGFEDMTAKERNSYLDGKRLRMSTRTTEHSFDFNATGDTDDLEVLFQLLYKSMTMPEVDAFDTVMANTAVSLEHMEKDKKTLFFREAGKIMSNTAYRRNYAISADLDDVTPERLLSLYKSHFTDAGNFIFVISGDVDLEKTIELGRIYLGSQPTPKTKATTVNRHVALAEHSGALTGYGDNIDKATIRINFDKQVPRVENGDYYAFLASRILQTRLRENIREDMGGAYSVGINFWYLYYPDPTFYGWISLTTNPEMKDDVLNRINEVLSDLASNGATAKDLETAQNQIKLQLDSADEENWYQANIIAYTMLTGEPVHSTEQSKAILDSITLEDLNAFIRAYMKEMNHFSAVYMPKERK